MRHINEFVDDRQKAWCVHCARALSNRPTNRDHVPTKALLNDPYPENLPVIEVCMECNEGFSLDEQYFAAFLGAVLVGSTDPESQILAGAKRILTKNQGLRERIERSKSSYKTIGGTENWVWTPEASRIERVVVKNARGHAFFELGEPMMDRPSKVWFWPLASLTPSERRDFEDVASEGWPEVGSRMLNRVVTGLDLESSWVVVQSGCYCYSVTHREGVLVRSVIRDYLVTQVEWR